MRRGDRVDRPGIVADRIEFAPFAPHGYVRSARAGDVETDRAADDVRGVDGRNLCFVWSRLPTKMPIGRTAR
jgi:hypothetical protein